jgi:hypothetical protein
MALREGIIMRCFLCKKIQPSTKSYAHADIYKPPELRFNGGGRIRTTICLECLSNPQVVRYKKAIIDNEWTTNPQALKKVGEP